MSNRNDFDSKFQQSYEQPSGESNISNQKTAGNSRPQVQLSADELRVLNECRRESFYYRCLPLCVALTAGVKILATRGIISSHPKYGITFKTLGACCFGFIAGKASYQGECKRKIFEQIPDSDFARRLRAGVSGFTNNEPADIDDNAPQPASRTPSNRWSPSNDNYGDSINVSSDRTPMTGLEESRRPSIDNDTRDPASSSAPQTAQSSTTYAQLRQKHREQYQTPAQSDSRAQYPSQERAQADSRTQYSDSTVPRSKLPSRPKYNQYGDLIED